MSLHVSLPPALEDYVREKVKRGLYGTASEVIREALRLLRERELSGEVQQGIRREEDERQSALAARLREELDLAGSGHALVEARLRREHPEASDREIVRRLSEWMTGDPREEEVPGHLERSPERLARLLSDDP